MDRVPDYESVGCTFESCHAHQTPEFSRGFLFIVLILKMTKQDEKTKIFFILIFKNLEMV